jgi:squalene synthase HpnC
LNCKRYAWAYEGPDSSDLSGEARGAQFTVSIPAAAPIPAELGTAYAYCERLARSHYENFPVASRLLPPAMRPHVAAVYAFARAADDFADEEERTAEERYRLLEDWRELLWQSATPRAANGPPYSPLFRALGHTIHTCGLSVSLFEDLLSAFRQDVATNRYRTWDELMDYCRRSANPIGRIVLCIAGYAGNRIERASDAICTALQLTNFWQDLAIDWPRGRLYVPTEDYLSAGASESDLDRRRITPAWRQALSLMADRTRTLFDEGRVLCDLVDGRLRFELRLTWLGGRLILDRLVASDFEVFATRPAVGGGDAIRLAWQAVRWSRSEPARG